MQIHSQSSSLSLALSVLICSCNDSSRRVPSAQDFHTPTLAFTSPATSQYDFYRGMLAAVDAEDSSIFFRFPFSASDPVRISFPLAAAQAELRLPNGVYLAGEAINDVDFNLDGDRDDLVPQSFDAAGLTQNFLVAARPDLVSSEDLVAFLAPESGNGDLDGDGDELDQWVYVYQNRLEIPMLQGAAVTGSARSTF